MLTIKLFLNYFAFWNLFLQILKRIGICIKNSNEIEAIHNLQFTEVGNTNYESENIFKQNCKLINLEGKYEPASDEIRQPNIVTIW